MGFYDELKFDTLIGKTFTSVVNNGDTEIVFTQDNGDKFRLYHEQDCCENVRVEDIIGDLDDLVGVPIVMAEEVSHNRGENPDGIKVPEFQEDSFIWTFYKLATIKGYVTIRWYGESNGYYSEEVNFEKIK